MLYLRWYPAHYNLHWVSLDLTLSTHPWGLKPCQQHQQFPLKHHSYPILLYFSAPKSLSNMASLLARYCLTEYLLLTSDFDYESFFQFLSPEFHFTDRDLEIQILGKTQHRSSVGCFWRRWDLSLDSNPGIWHSDTLDTVAVYCHFFPITRTQSW